MNQHFGKDARFGLSEPSSAFDLVTTKSKNEGETLSCFTPLAVSDHVLMTFTSWLRKANIS